MNMLSFIISALVTGVAGILAYRLIFQNADDLKRSFRSAVIPNIISLFRGDLSDDLLASVKIAAFATIPLGLGLVTFLGISSIKSEADITSSIPQVQEDQAIRVELMDAEMNPNEAHPLDDCYNDGAMWRASVPRSTIGGGDLEFMIPLDEENHEEGDPIPDHHKDTFNRFVANESIIKEGVSEVLQRWLKSRGIQPRPNPSSESPTFHGYFSPSYVSIEENSPQEARRVEIFFSGSPGIENPPTIEVDLITGELRTTN